MKKYSLFLAFLITASLQLTAQTSDTIQISVRATFDKEAMLVRWAPGNLYSWYLGNHAGYRIRRYKKADPDGNEYSIQEMIDSEVILADRLVIADLAQWESWANDKPLAGVVAASVFEGTFEIPAGQINMATTLQKKQEVMDRFSFSLFAADQEFWVAEAMGLGFKDGDIEVGYTYLYAIEMAEDPNPTEFRTQGVAFQKAEYHALEGPGFLETVAGDRIALLQWENQPELFTSYQLERTKEGAEKWESVSSSPITLMSLELEESTGVSYRDSLPENGISYAYRVKGKTPFGVFSEPSEPVFVTGVPDPKDLSVRIDTVLESTPGQIQIKWSLFTGNYTDISYYNLYKSPFLDGEYTLLKGNIPVVRPPNTYIDPAPGAAAYYYVEAVDANGHKYLSFPYLGQIADHTPPAVPTILIGTCDENGNTYLAWTKNHEPDFMAYRVYMAHGSEADFVQITSQPVVDSAFHTKISMNLLNEEVWFTVLSLDKRQNASAQSTPFKVTKPDIHPPAAPIITSTEGSANGVLLFWETSPSSDVVLHTLQRSETGSTQWVSLISFDPKNVVYSFLDQTASKRKQYTYRLEAKDDAGLKTYSIYRQSKPYDDGTRTPIKNVQHQYAPDAKEVYLQWDYEKDPQLAGFQIFRSIHDSLTRRSYAYLPVPTVINNTAGYDYQLRDMGQDWQATFIDRDIRFKVPQINTFVTGPHGSSQQPNLSLPNANATHTVYTLTNANNMTTKSTSTTQPAAIYYWIMADFKDGGFSPIYGPIAIQL